MAASSDLWDEDSVKIWNFYKEGSRVPMRWKHKVYVVDESRVRFPGVEVYFESAIWEVATGRALTPERIDALLLALGIGVQAVLFEQHASSDGKRRTKEFDFLQASLLVELGTFEAFSAAILLMAKSELIGHPGLRALARDAYVDLQPAMDVHPVIGPFCAEICMHIDNACKLWVFPSNQCRIDLTAVTHQENIRRAMEKMGAVRVLTSANVEPSPIEPTSTPGPDKPDELS